MSKYPAYACPCCGFTNPDMFWDRPVEPTEQEVMEFNAYRKMWQMFREERNRLIQTRINPRIGRSHTQATRDKISATKQARKVAHPKGGVE